mmetsp:Transcript_12504/g.46722  ORF Transcript_12504/g.46722 Transcript_12504/m.46722 type:complete len:215 (+) Transcript_12504:465-1109(+)
MFDAFARPAARSATLRRELFIHQVFQTDQLLRGPFTRNVLIPHGAPFVSARPSRAFKHRADILPLFTLLLHQIAESFLLLLAPFSFVVVRIVVPRDEPIHLLGVTRPEFLGNLQKSFPFRVVELRAASALLVSPLEEELVLALFEAVRMAVRRSPVLDASPQIQFLSLAPATEQLTVKFLIPQLILAFRVGHRSAPGAAGESQFFAPFFLLLRL